MPTLHAEVSNSNHRFVFKTYSKIFLLVCVPYFMQIKIKYSCKRILDFHAFSKPLILIKLIFWVKTWTKSTTVPNNIKQRACKLCINVLYRWQFFNLNWLEKQPIYLYLHYSKSTYRSEFEIFLMWQKPTNIFPVLHSQCQHIWNTRDDRESVEH